MAERVTATAELSRPANRSFMFAALFMLAVIAAGVGAFLALKGSRGEGGLEQEDSADGTGAERQAEQQPAILPLETFIVNLQVKGSFLKTTMQLQLAQPELPPTVESDVPRIRDSIIRVLSSKSSSDILSTAGKEKLREEIRTAVNETLGAEDVTHVYFTEFIVQ